VGLVALGPQEVSTQLAYGLENSFATTRRHGRPYGEKKPPPSVQTDKEQVVFDSVICSRRIFLMLHDEQLSGLSLFQFRREHD